MANLRHLLPSASGLVVFEAAGRLASFTAAARELGMSQAAVSYAVGRLEAQLGAALFHREHRRVRLTEAGTRFFADVSLGLSYIRRSAEELRAAASDAHVTLSASTAFAAFWMVPRLQKFREDLPASTCGSRPPTATSTWSPRIFRSACAAARRKTGRITTCCRWRPRKSTPSAARPTRRVSACPKTWPISPSTG